MLNNPYVPGDPYSYDLKWLVARVKEILAQLGTLDEAIEKKIFEGFLEHSIVQFKTVPEMLAADIKDDSIVLTLGYHEAGDHGGMFYLVKDFNPGQCSLDYFLTLDNNAQIAIPVIATPYVTPQMFGGYGDGEHDDTTAVQVSVNNADLVMIPAGKYNVSEQIIVPAHTTIKGIGEAAFYRTENGFSLFSLKNYVVMDSLIIYGKGERNPYGNQWDREIETTDTTGVTIKNCAIYYADYVGIWAESAKDVTIQNNTIIHYAYAGILCRDACRNVKVVDNTVKFGDDLTTGNRYAIILSAGSGSEKTIGCICSGNYLEDETAYWEAIDAHCLDDAIISENAILNFATGIAVGPRSTDTTIPSNNVTIANNVITQTADQHYGDFSTYGISLDSNGNGLSIKDNVINGAGNASATPNDKGGIKVRGKVSVTGNIVNIEQGSGLRILSAAGYVADGIRIAENMIDANGQNGIILVNSAGIPINGVIENNTIKNANVGIVGNSANMGTEYQRGCYCRQNDYQQVTTRFTNNLRGCFHDFQPYNPSGGVGLQGDIVYSSEYAGSGRMGWICTVSGEGSTQPVWTAFNG